MDIYGVSKCKTLGPLPPWVKFPIHFTCSDNTEDLPVLFLTALPSPPYGDHKHNQPKVALFLLNLGFSAPG